MGGIIPVITEAVPDYRACSWQGLVLAEGERLSESEFSADIRRGEHIVRALHGFISERVTEKAERFFGCWK